MPNAIPNFSPFPISCNASLHFPKQSLFSGVEVLGKLGSKTPACQSSITSIQVEDMIKLNFSSEMGVLGNSSWDKFLSKETFQVVK